MMELKYICPYWGQQDTQADQFVEMVLEAGFNGMEVKVPDDVTFQKQLLNKVAEHKLIFIAQQWLDITSESPSAYQERLEKNLNRLAAFEPLFINSHTGKDYYSKEENAEILELADKISSQSGVPVFHETHRGRFNFHAQTTLWYLERFPNLKLTGDFSHWCNVSESLLQDQEDILDKIVPHITYLHARVGHEQSPQVNDPRAEEWAKHLSRFCSFWDKVITHHQLIGTKQLCICPEFGPVPYMPTAPRTNTPLANQWELNIWMKDFLKVRYNSV